MTAELVALFCGWTLRAGSALAWPLLWLSNIVGISDLAYAQVATFLYNVDPAFAGAGYCLVVFNVPAMIVVHIVIFVFLLEKRA